MIKYYEIRQPYGQCGFCPETVKRGTMKFIHSADIHLGSKMESKLPKEKSDERKTEVRTAFRNMVTYAAEHGIGVIVLAGDVFDSDRPLKRDKEFFYSVVKNNPSIDFLYLRGNHDNMESYTESNCENLKTFSDEWTQYRYGDVVFYGIELNDKNALSLYSTLNAEKNEKNVVLLHGQTADASGRDKINLAKLRAKNIDYLALGHVHGYLQGKLDERGKYVYSGCLEGRGFDECGEKGFVVVDTDGFSCAFVKNSVRTVEELFVDCTNTSDLYTAVKCAEESLRGHKNDLVRLVLTGEISYDGEGLEREIARQLSASCYFLSVKNRTVRRFDIEALQGDLSLRGEFIRTVLGSGYSDEEKQRIISVGLNALGGREVE